MEQTPARTQICSEHEARVRLDHARKFYEVAELVASERALPPSASVAAALAILAGIAASDAACCKAMGARARSANHHDAEKLVARIEPGGGDAAKSLRRLLNLKDTAHYGLQFISGQNLNTTLRHAKKLVQFAEGVLE